LAIYQQSADLIQLGAHVQGANPKLDQSLKMRPQLLDFLKQAPDTHTSQEETTNRMLDLAKELQ